MKRLPDRPNLGHLKKQAKDLLALYRSGDPAAITRFRDALPAAAGKNHAAISALDLRLHDAQSCIAREYGFPSWADLQSFIAARNAHAVDPDIVRLNLLRVIYAGDIAGGTSKARPAVAARILDERTDLLGDDPYLSCAVGDVVTLRRETERDPAWVNRPGGPLALPPLVAVAHSSLIKLPAYRDRLHTCAKVLLEAGAEPSRQQPMGCFPCHAIRGSAFRTLWRSRSEPRSGPDEAAPRCRCGPQRQRVPLPFAR